MNERLQQFAREHPDAYEEYVQAHSLFLEESILDFKDFRWINQKAQNITIETTTR